MVKDHFPEKRHLRRFCKIFYNRTTMYNTTITSNNMTILVLKYEFHQPTTIILTSCSRSPLIKKTMSFIQNSGIYQRYIFNCPFQTDYKPDTNWKDLVWNWLQWFHCLGSTGGLTQCVNQCLELLSAAISKCGQHLHFEF